MKHAASLERLWRSAWLAYPALLLLQLRTIWGMWHRHDLTPGDTSSYFVHAWLWYRSWSENIGWSPLYTAFYGSFLHLSADPYFATIAHRVAMIFAIDVLLLAWTRRMLPPAIAWLVAAWWVVLPVTFDALYEVHLFPVLPVLGAGLVLVSLRGSRARGIVLAILVLTSFLVRNEYFITAAVLGALFFAAEARGVTRSRRDGEGRVLARLGAYAAPLLAVAMLVSFFYARSFEKFPELGESLSGKHTVNVCQIYAFGYMQRHTDWQGSPWTQCRDLMQRTFGEPRPTMMEALRRNPRAMLEHLCWNASLLPSGLQVLLFDATSGSVNPDYAVVRMGSRRALISGLAVCGLLGAGALALWRQRRLWWSVWLSERRWGWLYLCAVDCTMLVVAVMQRPRPSYLFPLGISVMTAAGMALFALLPRRGELVSAAAAVAAVSLFALAPAYSPTYQIGRPEGDGSRPLLHLYRRLQPFAELFRGPPVRFVSPHYSQELCSYLGRRVDRDCRGLTPQGLAATAEATYDDIDIVYVDETQPASRDSAAELLRDTSHWRIVTQGTDGGQKWYLLARRKPEA